MLTSEKYQHLIAMVANFRKDRPVLKAYDNELSLADFIVGESIELHHAIVCYVTNPDQNGLKDVEQEIADVLLFCMSLLDYLALDMYDVVAEKISYNYCRYPSSEYQDGDYQTKTQKCRMATAKNGYKKMFYG